VPAGDMRLKQSLCSPWATTTASVGCYYWGRRAARLTSTSRQPRGRQHRQQLDGPQPHPQDIPDHPPNPRQLNYEDLFRNCSDCCDSSSTAETMTELSSSLAPGPRRRPPRPGGSAGPVVPNGSRLDYLDQQTWHQLQRFQRTGEPSCNSSSGVSLGLDAGSLHRRRGRSPTRRLRALSLRSPKQLTGLHHCTPHWGSFGRAPANMSEQTALASVDFLFGDLSAGDRVISAFPGRSRGCIIGLRAAPIGPPPWAPSGGDRSPLYHHQLNAADSRRRRLLEEHVFAVIVPGGHRACPRHVPPFPRGQGPMSDPRPVHPLLDRQREFRSRPGHRPPQPTSVARRSSSSFVWVFTAWVLTAAASPTPRRLGRVELAAPRRWCLRYGVSSVG